MELIRIPIERVAILVGIKGSVKKKIERLGKARLKISKEGDVELSSDDPYLEWQIKDVIRAIARGFRPDKALKLFNEEYYLKIIDLNSIFTTEKEIRRYKGRVIGEKGKARRIIEETSEAEICVYGDTIGIIGKIEQVNLAQTAIEELLGGASHSKVYYILEQGRKKLKQEKTQLWERR